MSRRRPARLSALPRYGFLLPPALTSYLWLKGLHPLLPGFSCPLRALTGIPCPTCFLTRATTLALHGHLADSVRWHAFGPLAAGALLAWSVMAIRRGRLFPVGLKAWHLGVAAVGLVAYWVGRLVLSYGMGIAAFPTG
ncbi:DUF2752 domain-containing protein [Cyanobium sp. FGCU-52]|nr:DUF2752 domain-containing protein [Cyanobium sp. FGCU52]